MSSDSWMVTDDALFRIKVTLSSRRTAVETFRTTAQAYSLEGEEQPEWKPIASGVPCTIKQLDKPESGSSYKLKVVLADLQSGLSVWEEYVDSDANYYAYQGTFHTFKGISGKRFGLQISDANVAVLMLEHMYDTSLELAKHEANDAKDSVAQNERCDSEQNIKRRIKRVNTLSKKDISLPCNFVHISGVSKAASASDAHQSHLTNLLERKMKSLSAIVPPVSVGKKSKKLSAACRSSTDISHEKLFSRSMEAAPPSEPGTPERKPGEAVHRNTWNFGMLRKHSNGLIKEEKPARKGLFRGNSFSELYRTRVSSQEKLFDGAITSETAAKDEPKQTSPTHVQPVAGDSPRQPIAVESPRFRYSPSPPRASVASTDMANGGPSRFNTLPSKLHRSHSSASALRPYVPRHLREYGSLVPTQNSMTMTRYDTEPVGNRYQQQESRESFSGISTLPRHMDTQNRVPQQTNGLGPYHKSQSVSSSDLLMRRPARTQQPPNMKEEEVTAAAAATIARYTERMAKALQRFDDVLLHEPAAPQTTHTNSAVVC